MRSIQLCPRLIHKTWLSLDLILGLGMYFTSIVIFIFEFTTEARVVKASAWLFLVLGNFSAYTKVKDFSNYWASFIQASILWFWAQYSLVNWLGTSWELQLILRFWKTRALALLKPRIMALYSDSLLDASKPNPIVSSRIIHYGDFKITPTLSPFMLDAPSICML